MMKKSQPHGLDILITDVLMPNKEGLELIQETKLSYPHIHIIAISGGGAVGLQDCLMFADGFGADRVFAKPLRPQHLVEAVNELLGQKEVA